MSVCGESVTSHGVNEIRMIRTVKNETVLEPRLGVGVRGPGKELNKRRRHSGIEPANANARRASVILVSESLADKDRLMLIIQPTIVTTERAKSLLGLPRRLWARTKAAREMWAVQRRSIPRSRRSTKERALSGASKRGQE